MSRNDCSFFAISGIRGSGRTRLFKRLEFALPERFRDHTFAFFEDPFGALPHPLLWAREESKHRPTSRLFNCWARLNEFNENKLLPAQAAHDFVFVDGYGLNALLYATAFVGDNPEDDANAASMHHLIVKARVIGQDINPPPYFVTMADRDAMTEYLLRTVPGITVAQCHAFIQKEERVIRDYFTGTGQIGHLFDPSMSIDDMCDFVVAHVERRLETSLAA